MFDCFNINCYARFKSERGLHMHLWRSSSCKDYMEKQQSRSRASVDGCPEIVSTMRHHSYGVQSTRLNQEMDTEAARNYTIPVLPEHNRDFLKWDKK